ncbi:MAG: DUF1398 domain-containing protein [Pyrinomonadaceae bacterium]|nr:DUF1398 domain-containing protein [Pyrinomonadaceae bacterium]
MFTIQQINEANARVKTGADFPRLAQELFEMGVLTNDVYVNDGHAEFFGKDGFAVKTPATHPILTVADESQAEKFQHYLKIHQQGQTDYPTFLEHSAETGIEKWTLDFTAKTCTYLDKKGHKILVEKIPEVK